MAEITRIVIKGSSGYCCVDEAFNDKVTITEGSISYEYVPYVESEINPKRKWSYKTNSPLFKKKFIEIAKMTSEVIKRDIDEFCTDIGGIEFNITYSDRTKFKDIYWVPGDGFKELFMAIKSIVPETEYTPAVLLTSEDFDDEE
ncbi:MAG: hypothetical protein K6G02_03665 [Lactobacillus sp.]|nr:hypothetical protein [Lactobacillus sp.]